MTETVERFRLGTTDRRLDASAIEAGGPTEWPRRPGLTVSVLPHAVFNPRFRAALHNRIERLKAANGERPETNRHDDPQFVAEALIADMQGIHRADGSPVEYTVEIGTQLLSDPGNADVLEWVANESMNLGHFYEAQVEEDEKNS